MTLANDDHASAQVRGVASLKLDELKKWIATQTPLAKDEASRAELFLPQAKSSAFKRTRRTPFANARCAPGRRPIGSDDWE